MSNQFNVFLRSFYYFSSPFYRRLAETSVIGLDVSIGFGQSYIAKTNNLTLHGNQGTEQVTIAPKVNGITLDAAVESVVLTGVKFDLAALQASQGKVILTSSSLGSIATFNVAPNHSEVLYFSNAAGRLSLDSTGKAMFTLSNIELDPNQHYTASINNLQVYGNVAQEKVSIGRHVNGVTIANNIETVIFDGNFSEYTCTVKQSSVVVTNNSTGTTAAIVNINYDAGGTQLQFANKTLAAVWYPAGITVTDATPNVLGSANFHYSIDWSLATLGTYLSDVQNALKMSLDNIGFYLNTKVPLQIQVITERVSAGVLAETSATLEDINGANGITQTTAFLADSLQGEDTNVGEEDLTLYINLTSLKQMSFSGKAVAGKYDFVSVLTHEILHGLAFTGNLDTKGPKTPFDALVSIKNDSPVFTGQHAQMVHNSSVPLEPASAGEGSAYYHLTLDNDLMSSTISKGEIRSLSALDLAMLEDLGLSIVGISTIATT